MQQNPSSLFLASSSHYRTGDLDLKKWRNKWCIVVPVQFRVAGVLIERLLNEGIRVVALTNFLKRAESLRSQMDWKNAENLCSRECDLHSMCGMKAALLWIKRQLGEVHLLIYLLPKVRHEEDLFLPDNEHLMQQHLDVSMDSARAFLQQAEYLLFPQCCSNYCNSDLMWIVRYNLDAQEDVVDHLMARMARVVSCRLCHLPTLDEKSTDE